MCVIMTYFQILLTLPGNLSGAFRVRKGLFSLIYEAGERGQVGLWNDAKYRVGRVLRSSWL